MSDELKIGYISKQCLEKLQNPKWQALRGVWVELWTVDGPPSRCVVPVYTFSKNASAQAVDNSSDDLQPMQPGPFVYSAEVEIKGLRTQLAAMTAERDAALAQPAASEPQPVGRMEESGIIEGLIIPVVEGEFPEGTLLYAAPPAAPRTLTDAEIDAIADDMPGGMDGFLKSWGWRQFARAIARALSATPEQP